MPNRLGPIKVAVSAVIALGAVGGSVAYAYPSGTSMDVTASGAVNSNSVTDVAVTVVNANPNCQINIKVQGAPVIVVPAGRTGAEATQITRTTTISATSGQHRVRVSATDCSARERTQTVFDVADSGVRTSSKVYHRGDQFIVSAFGFTPNAHITFRLTPASGGPSLEQITPNVTNRQGKAQARFTIKGNAPTGDWVLSAYTGSVHNATTIQIGTSKK